jgi:HK97 family phage prohead protease
MRKLILGSRAFENRKLREFAESGDEPVLRRSFETEIKAVEESRAFDFVISSSAVDRYGDTVNVDGWKLTNFRKNPVVLWMHDNTLLPVAKASNIRVEDGKLKARAEFTPAGVARFNDTVFELLKTGFLSATSVGFLPLKYNFVDDPQRRFGIDFLEQELLEFSIVTVPALAEAMIEGRDIDAGTLLAEIAPVEAAVDVAAMSLDLAQHRIRALKLRAA